MSSLGYFFPTYHSFLSLPLDSELVESLVSVGLGLCSSSTGLSTRHKVLLGQHLMED